MKKRRGRPESLGKVGGIILSLIGVAGIIAFALVAPNAVRLLKYTPLFKHQRRYYVNTVIERCIQRGFLKRERREGVGIVLRLTPKGEALLAHYEFEHFTLEKPKQWDRKYRVIIFDIKEAKRSVRDTFRTWLERLGFIQLQKSVWVYPYECQEVVTLLKAHVHIGKDVLYLTVDSIENDRWLRELFKLPQ